jgi:hypothetical protein
MPKRSAFEVEMGIKKLKAVNHQILCKLPIPMAVRSKVWVCGYWLAGIAGSNPSGGKGVCLL